ncbi:MAG TPA: xanthine dehydrogenase family protein subunit M [Azospirillum sp.]|nr:xanthine dehydrogenase family protein subunit M [Azospirillum sp.]
MTDVQRYEAPTTLEAAAEILKGGDVTILAGGTDLMPQSEAGRIRLKPVLMNIRRVAELRGIEKTDGMVRIGALTTITEILESDLIRDTLPVLAEAADRFASGQIRNMGTIGGNICNASPAGDTLVPLLVLNAEVELAGKPNGHLATRRVALADFLAGPGRTRREAHELLAAVVVPVPPEGFRARFAKFGTRPALDISAVSVAVGGVLHGGVFTDVRAAFGAVAPTPIRGPATEAALEGKRLDDATIEAAAQAAHDEVRPIDDVRASAWYRREMIHSLTRKVLSHVADA